MAPPQVEPKGGQEHTCDIMIFDEERDQHIRVTWADAMAATLVGSDGFLTAHGETKMVDGKNNKNLAQWASDCQAWKEFNEGSEKTFSELNPDVRIIVARPFIEYAASFPLPCSQASHTHSHRISACLQARDAQCHHGRCGSRHWRDAYADHAARITTTTTLCLTLVAHPTLRCLRSLWPGRHVHAPHVEPAGLPSPPPHLFQTHHPLSLTLCRQLSANTQVKSETDRHSNP